MGLYEAIMSREEKIAVIGLGYVGLPIAVAFAKKVDVIGFDINKAKIDTYRQGSDPTKEVGEEELKKVVIEFTAEEARLRNAKFHIIAVPTPLKVDNSPDFEPLKSACHIVGRNLIPGAYIIFESTVYPGATEEICIPILEKESGMKCGADFKVGYSPERINPGDKIHRFHTIIKVVSGSDEEALEVIAKVYEMVVEAGVYRASSIKVAEAAKAIENAQRDINIAFMNELSIIFGRAGIDTKEVLQAAGTKWNFMHFAPGLVGGHCIGVDPYYLTYKAEQLGYRSQIILSGRRINDDMGSYIIQNLIKQLILADIPVRKAAVAILGLTFKENCPDIRNTRVFDMIRELKEYGISPTVTDPQAEEVEVLQEYDIRLTPMDRIENMNAVIIAVAHDEYRQLTIDQVNRFFREGLNQNKLLMDIKGILNKEIYALAGYRYWSL
ncbi:MAG: capL [Herbinix sp.]|nr:capL [Herbinix sp.]